MIIGGSPVFVFRIDMATGYCFDTKTNQRIWPRDEDIETAGKNNENENTRKKKNKIK